MVDMIALKDTSVRRGTATITSPSGDVTIRIRPLPDTVKEFLIKHAESMKQFLLDRKTRVEEEGDVATERVTLEKRLSFQDFRKEFQEILNAEGGDWSRIIDRHYIPPFQTNNRICAFGPRRLGPNILVDSTDLGFRRMYHLRNFG